MSEAEMETNALALEYKRYYGSARGNLNVHNLVNDPTANGECRVFGRSLSKEGFDLVGLEVRALGDDVRDPSPIGKQTR